MIQCKARLLEIYEVSIKFGEYAAPGFENVVETIGKAKAYNIMSTEKCIEELYGDTMTDEEKAEEVNRIKAENSTTVSEPLVNTDIDLEGDSSE